MIRMKPITRELLENFPLEKMVYAEYGEIGAMGAEGKVFCYIIENNELVQYFANVDELDEDLFFEVVELINKHSDTTYYYYIVMNKKVPQLDESIHFYGIYGSLGNHVMFNRHLPVSFTDTGYFIEIDNKRFEFNSCMDYIYKVVKPQIIAVYDYLKKNVLEWSLKVL